MGLSDWLYRKVSNYFTTDRPSRRAYLCDFDRVCYEVRPADVLLVEGRNRISNIIQRVTLSPWSHAALYIGRLHDIEDPYIREHIQRYYQGPPGEQLLVESIVGKGTLINPISYYKDDHIRICRPTGLSHRDAQQVIAYATKRVGREYNVRHFIDLGRFLVAGRFFPGKWRSSLFKKEPGKATEEICSSMIASAFAAVKFPVLPLIRETEDLSRNLELIKRNPKLTTPSDFDYSPYFNIIKYPLFPVSNVTPYRSLPWHEGLVSSDHLGIQTEDEEALPQKKKKKIKNEPTEK